MSRTCRSGRRGVLAKTASSLDVMGGGRFELGLGAGSFRDAIAAMCAPRRAGVASWCRRQTASRIAGVLKVPLGHRLRTIN
jgi:alkanesulfonate monooxygenase SsuD/methylene tetrahydromethanopterin reductase-like flavin-dependent oxidoreductase (luciferase family)